MGRLVKDVEIRYTQSAEPTAIANYTLAVNKIFKREGEADADFINVVSFAKAAEFAEKYYRKGQQVAIVGRLQTRSYDDKEGNKRYVTEVVASEQFFADSKRAEDKPAQSAPVIQDGFVPISQEFDNDDGLPF